MSPHWVEAQILICFHSILFYFFFAEVIVSWLQINRMTKTKDMYRYKKTKYISYLINLHTKHFNVRCCYLFSFSYPFFPVQMCYVCVCVCVNRMLSCMCVCVFVLWLGDFDAVRLQQKKTMWKEKWFVRCSDHALIPFPFSFTHSLFLYHSAHYLYLHNLRLLVNEVCKSVFFSIFPNIR